MKTATKSLIGLACALAFGQAHAISVSGVTGDLAGGTTLANNILGAGVSITSITYSGDDNQGGTFTGGNASGLDIDSGIMLTTGSVYDAPGPNNSDNAGTNSSQGGYAPLDALLSGTSTFDSNILAITFTTTTGDLFFNFAFASEEYNEFVNSSFNDVFAFFLDGTAPSDNIALTPNGNVVAINNVNCGNPYDAGSANPDCAYFNNNDLQDGGPFFDIQYDGFTDSFTAAATGLDAGEHTIIMAIADAGDSGWDSAVFIEGGSFGGEPPTEPPPGAAPEPATLLLLGAGMIGMGASVRRRRRS